VTLRFPGILFVAAALVEGSSNVTIVHGFNDSTTVHV
jgi:hypothetical protein